MLNSAYILIPVHNRKSITLNLLDHLNRSQSLDRYSIVVIDDGSTDGTSEAIQGLYSQVSILKGDGNLWWTGAIVKGMQFAIDQGAEFIIWLNDDTIPRPDAIPRLIAVCQDSPRIIASAQCYGDVNLVTPTYGAQKKRGISIRLRSTSLGTVQTCDALSGNLVCFSSRLVKTIGYPDAKRAPHCQADIIYTYQAKKAGYIPTVIGDAIAICDMNPLDIGWINSPTNMLKRWQIIGSPKSNLYPPAYWYYCQQFYGPLGILPFMNVYLRLVILTGLILILPTTWMKKMKHWKDQWF
jgi:GT2 family glycosyltransferase